MGKLIASHEFLPAKVDSDDLLFKVWRGGHICQCGRARYEHQEHTQTYSYSSWSISRVINEQITLALAEMRQMRAVAEDYRSHKCNVVVNNETLAMHYDKMAQEKRHILMVLFEIHHAGLGTEGSWAKARERATDRYIKGLREFPLS
jgi:hypothetical protein